MGKYIVDRDKEKTALRVQMAAIRKMVLRIACLL